MTTPSKAATYKVMFLGNTCVGKTSLIRKALFNTYNSKEKRSVVVESYTSRQENTSFIIYDAPGQIKYSMYAEPFIKEMSCICLVVDASNEESCLSISYWQTKIPKHIPILLICNKSDISSKHVGSHGLPSIETSAKKGHNTSTLLSTIRDTIVQDERAKMKGSFTERAIMPK